jgi:hypothetical protein
MRLSWASSGVICTFIFIFYQDPIVNLSCVLPGVEMISLTKPITPLHMKTRTSSVLILVCTALHLSSFAQKVTIKVAEETASLGSNKKNALVVSIYDVTGEEIMSKWRSLMKSYKAKNSSGEEIFSDNAVIATINGNNTIDSWAKTEKLKDGEMKFIVAFDLGGALLSSANNASKFNEAKKMVHDFAVKTMKEGIIAYRKAQEKILENLQDDQNDLVKEQNKLTSNTDDYKAKIEEYNKKVKEAQDALAKNKTNQEKKKIELDAQKKTVEAAVAKEAAIE